MSGPPGNPYPVLVHPFPSPTRGSCAYELGPTSSKDALVFIGGLGDGPHTTPYIRTIATELEKAPGLSYSVFEIRMSSSFAGYGFTSLKDDVADLSAFVQYLRGLGKRKVIFLGHSTGCQDCVEYADYAKHGNEPVDGFILQGAVSDREAFGGTMTADRLEESLRIATDMIKAGNESAIMPRDKLPAEEFPTPVTAYRWNSLLAPGGDDDFFSSDLPDTALQAIWSRFQKPVLILPSGADRHVPSHIDVPAMVARWKSFCRQGIVSDLSGQIPGASHTVWQPEAQLWMAGRVTQFLRSLE